MFNLTLEVTGRSARLSVDAPDTNAAEIVEGYAAAIRALTEHVTNLGEHTGIPPQDWFDAIGQALDTLPPAQKQGRIYTERKGGQG